MASTASADKELDRQLFGKPNPNQPRVSFKRCERGCAVTLLLGALFTAGTLALLQWPRGSPPAPAAPERRAFEAWAAARGRRYASPGELEVRLAIFSANFRRVQTENARGLPYKLALNDFADLTSEEFRASHLGLAAPERSALWRGLPRLGVDSSNTSNTSDLPEAWDWVSKGAVTPPKNQGQCGSCWAFSTTGALEGAWQIASGALVPLSEQQLVDCSKENNACGGGSMDTAFDYVKDHALCTEASYPYAAKAGACRAQCQAGLPRGAVAGYRDVAEGDERALMEAVLRQPVSVAIEADQAAFQLYQGGVLTKACGDKLDHGVLLVGFGTEGGIDYWKVKNSWGSGWGEGGFVRIQRGAAGPGECGIQSMPSYPVVGNATQSSLDRQAASVASAAAMHPSSAGARTVVV